MPLRKLVVLIAFLATGAHAQWLNFPTPGTPRTSDGKPNLTAPAPRALDGKPDLSGVWMHELTSVAEVKRLFGSRFDDAIKVDVPGMEIGTQHKYAFDILLDYKPEEAMLRPEGAEILRQHRRTAGAEDPARVCTGVIGIPLAGLLSEPIKIVQAPRLTMLLYEVQNLRRQIYTDGRALPKEVNLPAYMGYSAGHWEHDTLVVETAGFNDKTTLDAAGHPHGEALHITERFHRLDFGHMDVEMTFDDPQMYTKPFTIKIPHICWRTPISLRTSARTRRTALIWENSTSVHASVNAPHWFSTCLTFVVTNDNMS
ncbi:MAG: hypothetical protein ABSG13_23475 [Bryobacteraceae bacterium]|jgi:hypothetical protein